MPRTKRLFFFHFEKTSNLAEDSGTALCSTGEGAQLSCASGACFVWFKRKESGHQMSKYCNIHDEGFHHCNSRFSSDLRVYYVK